MNITSTMLAGILTNPKALRYPVICSPKLDGIRCIKQDGKALARSFKPIRNDYIRTMVERLAPEGADGELMAGDTFQACSSGVMGKEGEPDFTYWVFDIVSTPVGVSKTYTERMVELEAAIKAVDDKHIRFVPITQINSYDELLVYEDEQLANGFEGVMIRDPNGPYKCGRSTEREGWLLKLKRFEDSEAEIIGFEELMHNNNVATIDELGHTKRSSAKAGKAPAGTLGKFKVRDVKSGVDFSCGTGVGLTQAKRQEIWDNRSKYMGKIIKYKSQTVGVKDAPRVPVYLGFRDPIDM